MQNLCLNILFENNAIGPYEFNLQSKINGYDSWYNSANNLTIFFNKLVFFCPTFLWLTNLSELK